MTEDQVPYGHMGSKRHMRRVMGAAEATLSPAAYGVCSHDDSDAAAEELIEESGAQATPS